MATSLHTWNDYRVGTDCDRGAGRARVVAVAHTAQAAWWSRVTSAAEGIWT